MLSNAVVRAIDDFTTETKRSTMYPREMYEYLSLKYTVLDVEAMLFPFGFFNLPAGLIEDTLLYIMTHHKLFR